MTININGTTGISGVDGSAGTPAIQGSDTNTGVFFGTNTIDLSTDGTSRLSIGADGDLNVDSGTLFVDASTNQVGIGTTSPSDILHVNGGTSTKMRIGSNTANDQFIHFNSNADWSLGIDNSNTNAFTLSSTSSLGSSQKLTVTTGGSLGVNTVSPSDELHVVGTIRTSSGSNFSRLSNNFLRAEAAGAFFFDQNTIGQSFSFRVSDASALDVTALTLDTEGRLFAFGPQNFGSGTAANVVVDVSTGQIRRSTSSKKYKTDIETLEDSYADALLECRPVWYRSTADDSVDNPHYSYYGFIAEEVAEIDPRLVVWKTAEVTIDEQGNRHYSSITPEAESVQYDRFVPHLINLVKRQKQQIESLEARLSVLEGGAN